MIRHPLRMFPHRRQRLRRFPHHSYRLLVHAHQRLPWIVGPGIGLQHLFDRRDEFCVLLWRNHAVLDLVTRNSVFLSVCRAVSWLIEATMLNSTTRRARSRRDELEEPSGGAASRSASNCASCFPSNSFGTAGRCAGTPPRPDRNAPARSAAVCSRPSGCGGESL